MLTEVVSSIQVQFDYYYVSIWLPSEESQVMTAYATVGRHQKAQLLPDYQIPLDAPKSIIIRVYRTGLPYLAQDVNSDPEYWALAAIPDTNSEIALPLRIGQKIIGVMDIQSDRPNAFDPEDVALLQTIATQIGVAVRNAQLYEDAHQARQEAEEANKTKTLFLANMSHELRTPLGAIIGFIGILQMGMIKDKKEALPLSATQQRMLKDSRSNAEHLLTLINSILDLAKVSSGRILPNFSAVNPQDENFIAGTVLSLRSLAISKGIDLNLEIDYDLPAEVQCDLMQMKQVVKNLVGNAIKFTEKGQVTVYVRKKSAEDWQILVQDTGIGIKPEQVKNIFDPFYQADNSDSRTREGTGLGLAIAKSYVELHHGGIQVHSTLGTGTTFTVTLPNNPPSPTTAAPEGLQNGH